MVKQPKNKSKHFHTQNKSKSNPSIAHNPKSKPKSKSKNRQQQDDEQIQDIMSWGKSKQNYYQQQQQQYSQASQQQDQAKQIYQNQYQELNNNQYYQLPQEILNNNNKQLQESAEDQDEQQQGKINDQYIDKQILWTTELAKVLEHVKGQQHQLKKKIYDSYLLILLTLKQFKIPHMDQHPLVKNLPVLKMALNKFQQELLDAHLENQQDERQDGEDEDEEEVNQQSMEDQQKSQNNQEQEYSDDDENNNFDQLLQEQEQQEQDLPQTKSSKTKPIKKTTSHDIQGLQLYNKLKKQKQQQRKIKKYENKQARQKNRPKQAFRVVSEHEGRLANEKILKNKIMMKRRRRDDGNSRTKLRHKYQKALIRRKAKGYNGVRQNPGRYYQGQNKVLYGKIASTKLK